jgi:ribonuclease P protein component
MQGVGTIPKGFRFPAALRLKKTREFNDVYRRGRRARGRLFLVVFLRNELPYSRIGLSVGKRIGGAVRRNKVKRMLREAFRRTRHELPSGLDLVVVAEERTAKYHYADVASELQKLLSAPGRKPRPQRSQA